MSSYRLPKSLIQKSEYHQFQSQDILLLTDDGQPASMSPTRKNMFDAMKWLIKDAKIHDSLFFHCNIPFFFSSSHSSNSLIIAYVDSGHGGQVKDETGQEADGMDEGMYWVLTCCYNIPIDHHQLYFRSISNQLAISSIMFVSSPIIMLL